MRDRHFSRPKGHIHAHQSLGHVPPGKAVQTIGLAKSQQRSKGYRVSCLGYGTWPWDRRHPDVEAKEIEFLEYAHGGSTNDRSIE